MNKTAKPEGSGVRDHFQKESNQINKNNNVKQKKNHINQKLNSKWYKNSSI